MLSLSHDLVLPLPGLATQSNIIMITPSTKASAPLVTALQDFRKKGVRIALDSFDLSSDQQPLIPYTDIVAVDVLHQPSNSVVSISEHFNELPVALMARNVDTYQAFEFCGKAGFELFQGEFLCKPEKSNGKDISSSQLAVLKLLEMLQDESITFAQLGAVIDQDPILTLKLVKLVNSPIYRRGREIDSIERAVSMLGIQQVKKLVSMISVSAACSKPDALVVIALTRANMLEHLARFASLHPGQLFLAGVLSLMDAFMDRLLPSLIEGLSLTNELKRAVLHLDGPMGTLLKASIQFERAQWQQIDWQALSKIGVTPDAMRDSYLHGLQMAQRISNELDGAHHSG